MLTLSFDLAATHGKTFVHRIHVDCSEVTDSRMSLQAGVHRQKSDSCGLRKGLGCGRSAGRKALELRGKNYRSCVQALSVVERDVCVHSANSF